MAQVVRSQQHHDPVTELNQTQTRSRSEMGEVARKVFFGQEGKPELGIVGDDKAREVQKQLAQLVGGVQCCLVGHLLTGDR